jgi:hypothetical protein
MGRETHFRLFGTSIELDDKDEALMESFLSSRIVLQGPNRPPSRAVRGWRTQDGLWRANKGRFTFPFAFRLPGDIPSSVQFKSILGIKYKVTGLVEYKYSSRSKDTAFVSTDACIVERVDLGLQRSPIKDSISERPWLSRGGPITMECTIRSPLVCAGQEARLDIAIHNASSRKVSHPGVERFINSYLRTGPTSQDLHFPSPRLDKPPLTAPVPLGRVLSTPRLFSWMYPLSIHRCSPWRASHLRPNDFHSIVTFECPEVDFGRSLGLDIALPRNGSIRVLFLLFHYYYVFVLQNLKRCVNQSRTLSRSPCHGMSPALSPSTPRSPSL